MTIVSTRSRFAYLYLLAAPVVLLLAQSFAYAENKPLRSNGLLRWGGDQEGGGPFIFPKPDRPDEVTGFEVELAQAISERLGLKSQFVQCTWDQILQFVTRGDIDIALNGYEYTHERSSRYQTSIPYYIYELGLFVRRDDPTITQWETLGQDRKSRRLRVGVLQASAADDYVTASFGETVEILRFEGSTEAMRLVETGQLDATVQDMPIAQFYIDSIRQFENLRQVGDPRAPGYYVIYAREEDGALIQQINEAIRELYSSGRLQAIYERYGIWNQTQEKLPAEWQLFHDDGAGSGRGVIATFKLYLPLFLQAASTTVLLAICSMPVAILIGLVVALMRRWGEEISLPSSFPVQLPSAWVRAPFSLYVELVRGTPLLFQIFVVFYVLPELGIRIPPFWSGVIALAVNYGAYEAEVFRLGLQAVPRGQMEAALALGMSRSMAGRRIIVPQAFRMVIPAMANDFISLFKDTSICSVIAVMELSKQFSMSAKSTGQLLTFATLTCALYLAMSYPLSLVAGYLERRLARTST